MEEATERESLSLAYALNERKIYFSTFRLLIFELFLLWQISTLHRYVKFSIKKYV